MYDQSASDLRSIPLHGRPVPRHRVRPQRHGHRGPEARQSQDRAQRQRSRYGEPIVLAQRCPTKMFLSATESLLSPQSKNMV